MICAQARPVGRHRQHLQAVDLGELAGGGPRGGRHPAEPRVLPQVVLDGDRAEDLPLRLLEEPLFRLQGRLQAVRPVAVLGDPAGQLVHQLDAAVPHDVVDVAPQQGLGVQGVAQLGLEPQALRREQVPAAQQLLGPPHAAVGEEDVAGVFVGREIEARLQPAGDFRQTPEVGPRLVEMAGDHQRDPRLVDQDRVGLVHQSEMEGAVDLTPEVETEAVAQEVEPGLLHRQIGDVAAVGPLPLPDALPLLHAGDGEPEALVDGDHPAGVPAGQVVVEGEHVHPAAGEGVEGYRRHGRQGLPLAGLHLHQLALVESDAGEHLLVIGTLPEGPAGDLAHQREAVREQLLGRLAVAGPLPQGARPVAELLVPGARQVLFAGIDGGEQPLCIGGRYRDHA
jgi:hypothetical protein